MRKGILGSIPALLAGAGLALAQSAPVAQPAVSRGADATPLAAWGADTIPLPPPIFRGAPDPDNAFDIPPPEPIHDNAFNPDAEPGEECHPRFWGTVEYLNWAVRNTKLPPLLSTGPLGTPGTQVLIGSQDITTTWRPGARGAIGMWLQPYIGLPIGIEVGGFVLSERSNTFQASSNSSGNPLLGRPFLNATTGIESIYPVSGPIVPPPTIPVTVQAAGGLLVQTTSQLYNTDFTTVIQPGGINEFPDFLIGFRYLNLNENIGINQQSTILGNTGGLLGFPGIPPAAGLSPGYALALNDTFQTSNTFYGLNLGLRSRFSGSRFYGDLYGKIGIGATQEVSRIYGSSTLTTPFGVTTVPGGLLALSSNSGSSTRYDFAVVPETGVNFGFFINRYMDVHVGYTFLYWSKVQRPTQLIDTRVNPALVPTSSSFGSGSGPSLPLATNSTTGFWAQGVSAGLSFRY